MLPDNLYDVNEAGAESEDPGVRRRFVKHVSGYVSLQLAITAMSIVFGIHSDQFKKLLEMSEVECVGFLILALLPVLMVVSRPYARHGCIGVICILWLTLMSSILAVRASVESSIGNVIFAASSVAIITLTFACISACTNFDITKYCPFVAIYLWIVILWVVTPWFLMIAKPSIRVIELVFGIVGTLEFSVMLLYNVQTIMGGSVVAVKTDEVLYAMIQLYLVIVLIYVCLVMLKLL